MNAGRRSVLGWLDGLLVLIATGLAVWSAGESINVREISWLFVGMVAAGGLVSAAVRKVGRGQRWLEADGWLYAIVALAIVFNLAPLNALLPEDGFPRQIGAAGFLCWTIGFGSFFAWRDGTMLFGTIPAMALFGLCGCFDTYRPLAGLFFLFLLCLATLLARAHARDMLRQAKASGFGGDLPEDSPVLAERIRRGPWRWLAGPEWALASALAIILISSLGAPVVQSSVQGVAGIVPLAPPPIRRNSATTPGSSGITSQSTVQVGRGPNDTLSKTPLYEVRMPTFRYLRTAMYDSFTGTGWATSPLRQAVSQTDWTSLTVPTLRNPIEEPFEVRTLGTTSVIPVPGEIRRWDGSGMTTPRLTREGSWVIVVGRVNLRGATIAAAPDTVARDVVTAIPDLFASVLIPPAITSRTREFVDRAVAGATTDLEKADRLKRAIAAQARYNLRAPAVPAGADPVDTFLFGTREGYCDLYATAMTVAARSAGLPARYVQGFLPDQANRLPGGTYVVLESDYHAWCEVWFQDAGWVVFDATEGTAEVPGEGRGDATESDSFFSSELFRSALDWIVGGIVVAGLLGAAWTLRPAARLADGREEARALQASLVRSLERHRKHRREPGETLAEMARAEGVDPGLIADLDAAMYAPPGPMPGTLAARTRAEIARLARRSG